MSKVKTNWGLKEVWGKSLELARRERPPKERDYIYASEVGGKSFIDVYHNLIGDKPTNPPNTRSLGKFESGNLWEWIAGFVLRRAGLLKESQEHLSFQYPGLLKVTGRLDFLAGGKPDWDQAKTAVKEVAPDFMRDHMLELIELYKENNDRVWDTMILEIKSCSSRMFEKYQESQKPLENHEFQIFTYLKAKDLPEGHIVYISKDDSQVEEFIVRRDDKELEGRYKAWIEKMTYYYNKNIEPPKEADIVIRDGKFNSNYMIEYSSFLTKFYGHQTPREYTDSIKGRPGRWNRVLKRVEDGEKMTKNNLEALEEMKLEGFKIN